jgi:hypothetical protein
MKAYQYIAVVTEDRAHLDDPDFLQALNDMGVPEGAVACPWCWQQSCGATADGYKQKEEREKGASKLAILMEREVTFKCAYPSLELATAARRTS